MSHFGKRIREGLRSLNPSSFKCVNDSDGLRYVAMAYNETDKTHHGVDSREKKQKLDECMKQTMSHVL